MLQLARLIVCPLLKGFSPSNKQYDAEIKIRVISSAVLDPTSDIITGRTSLNTRLIAQDLEFGALRVDLNGIWYGQFRKQPVQVKRRDNVLLLDSARLSAAVFHEGVGCPRADRYCKIAQRDLRCHCDRNDSVCGGLRSARFLMCAISTSDAFIQVLHAGRNARPRIMRNGVALSGFPHRSGEAWI
jgi:hypothetical protein